MKLFEVSPKGVSLGATNALGSANAPFLEFHYPANFHTKTTLPDFIDYNPPWWSVVPFIVNGATSTAVPIAVKKVGTHVYMQRAISCRVDGKENTFMILPPELAPTYDHYFIAPSTTAGRMAAFCLYKSGLLKIQYTILPQNENYNTSTSVNKGTWRFDFNTDWFVADNNPLTQDVMQARAFTDYYNRGMVDGLRLRGNAGIAELTHGSHLTFTEQTNHVKFYSEGVSYGYITTDGPILVPSGKTSFNASLCHYNNASASKTLYASLFLIDAEETTITRNSSNGLLTFSGNYGNSICGANIGFTRSINYGNNTNYGDYSVAIDPATFDYARPVYAGISFRITTASRRDLYTNHIWFE